MLFFKYEMLIEGGWVCIDWSRQSKALKLFIWCNKRFLGSGGLIDYPYRLGIMIWQKFVLRAVLPTIAQYMEEELYRLQMKGYGIHLHDR